MTINAPKVDAAAAAAAAWRFATEAEADVSYVVEDLPIGRVVLAATPAGLVRIEALEMRRAPPAGVARLLAPAPKGSVFALYATAILRVGDTVEERIELPVDPARAQADAMDARPDGTLLLRVAGKGYMRPPGGPWHEEGPGPEPRASVERDGETWVATRGRGILRRRVEPYFRTVKLPRSPRVHALALGKDGTLWCGTSDGLAAVRPGGATEAIAEIGGQQLGVVTACASTPCGQGTRTCLPIGWPVPPVNNLSRVKVKR